MKKIILILTILLTTISAKSQITKGNWMFGGDATFYSFTTERKGLENLHSTNITINPNISYFVIDKLAVGLKIGTSFQKNNTSWAIGPVARYYFLETDKIFNLFTEASFKYGRNIPKGRNSTTGTSYNAKVGIVAFLNKSVGLEFGIDYNRAKDHSNNNVVYNTLKVAFGFQIHLKNKN